LFYVHLLSALSTDYRQGEPKNRIIYSGRRYSGKPREWRCRNVMY